MSRIQVDNILDKVGDGAPTFPNGLVSAGVVTATSFVGSGASLTGIDATSLKDGGGTIRVQANTSGAVVTGVLTATSLKGNGGAISGINATNITSGTLPNNRFPSTLPAVDGSQLTGIESGVANFVASGTIPNGMPVIINSDGTVGVVTASVSSTPSFTNPISFSSGAQINSDNSCLYDPVNKKVIVVYEDDDNNKKTMAVVGTVVGDTIEFGTPVLAIDGSNSYTVSVYDSTNDKVIIVSRVNNTQSSNFGQAFVGTVSGNSITFGSANTFYNASASLFSAAVTTSGKLVVAYQDNGNFLRAKVGTLSGTTISFGAAATIGEALTSSMTVDPVNDKVVVVYSLNSSFQGNARVGTVSGTSISFGNAVIFNNASTSELSSVYDIGNQKIVVLYRYATGTPVGKIIAGTVSGTDISFGSAVDLSSDIGNSAIAYDSRIQKVVAFYTDNGNNNNGRFLYATLSGTNISLGTQVTFNGGTSSTNGMGAVYDPNTDRTIVIFKMGAAGDSGVSKMIRSSTVSSNLTSENYIGIAAEAISNGATGKITVVSGTNSSQTGLTMAKKYFVQNTGGIGTITSSPPVVAGTSISSTKILVR